MWSVVLVLSAAALMAEASDVAKLFAPCKPVLADESINLTKLKALPYVFKQITATITDPKLSRVSNVKMKYSKKQKGAIEFTVYYKTKDCKPAILCQGLLSPTGPGRASLVVVEGKKTITVNVVFFKFSPGNLAYIYLCSDIGQSKIDVRLVALGLKKYLNSKDEAAIKKLDAQYFPDGLKNIDLHECKAR